MNASKNRGTVSAEPPNDPRPFQFNTPTPAPTCDAKESRPFQFSLRTLMLATTVAAVLLAAASGALGQVAQFVMLSLFLAVIAFLFEALGGLLLLALIVVTIWLPLWLAERLFRVVCQGVTCLVRPIMGRTVASQESTNHIERPPLIDPQLERN